MKRNPPPCEQESVLLRHGSDFPAIVCAHDLRLRGFPGSSKGAAWRDDNLFLDEALRAWEIHRINPCLVRGFIEKRNASGIRVHSLADVRRSRAQHLPKLQVRRD